MITIFYFMLYMYYIETTLSVVLFTEMKNYFFFFKCSLVKLRLLHIDGWSKFKHLSKHSF